MVTIVPQDETKAEIQNNPAMFIGQVLRQEIVTEVNAPSQRVNAITFTDGARNRWHSHSTEQVLVVTHGEGVIADSHGEQAIRAGDVVLIQPHERHWHGAAPGRSMTHLAILLPGDMTIDPNQS